MVAKGVITFRDFSALVVRGYWRGREKGCGDPGGFLSVGGRGGVGPSERKDCVASDRSMHVEPAAGLLKGPVIFPSDIVDDDLKVISRVLSGWWGRWGSHDLEFLPC